MAFIKYKSTLSVLLFLGLTLPATAQHVPVKEAFAHAEKQTQLLIKNTALERKNHPELVSPRTLEDGHLKLVRARDWTSGFFPGVIWYLYDFTKAAHWKEEARNYTGLIEGEKNNAGTHDMGFKIFCSYGNAYRLSGDAADKDVLLTSAKTLSSRFSPKTKLIRSWDHNSDKWKFPVIIDNMMNLELLFEATKMSGDSSYYRIAVSHADETMKNHFRPDYGTYHVVDYDPETGAVVNRHTHQGYQHESTWARGEAWALYGYTLCYRYTKDKRYLAQAEHIAKFLFSHPHMPKDLIPYWDFDAPEIPNEPRDASAAAVIASALYELAQYSTAGEDYKQKASTIISNLYANYTFKIGEGKGFILNHSTGSKAHQSEVDVPLNYADYYYLEALLRYNNQ